MLGKKKKRGEGEGEMTFLQHLEELRWHLIRAFIAVVAGAIVAFVCKTYGIDERELKSKRRRVNIFTADYLDDQIGADPLNDLAVIEVDVAP